MALSKNISTIHDVDATFWVATKIIIDRINLSAEIHLSGYATAFAEEKRAQPLEQRVYHVQFVDEEIHTDEPTGYLYHNIPPQLITPDILDLFNSLSTTAYNIIKQSSEFSDATIV